MRNGAPTSRVCTVLAGFFALTLTCFSRACGCDVPTAFAWKLCTLKIDSIYERFVACKQVAYNLTNALAPIAQAQSPATLFDCCEMRDI